MNHRTNNLKKKATYFSSDCLQSDSLGLYTDGRVEGVVGVMPRFPHLSHADYNLEYEYFDFSSNYLNAAGIPKGKKLLSTPYCINDVFEMGKIFE
jgi:hypothetical protein